MSKHVLILSTSPRKGGNSEALAHAFASGAIEAGHRVEQVCLYDKSLEFCRGCLVCQQTKRCVIHDDVAAILEKMAQADAVVFATPVYFYEMCGQMKTLLDRTNPLFPAEYAFRDIYLLAAAADGEDGAMDGAVQGLEGWISCFPQSRLAGVLRGTGVDAAGAVQARPALLERAARMGRSV